jgi:glyoxylase-like metal-dependent hydrolase (beta-lactamase superfamily II)
MNTRIGPAVRGAAAACLAMAFAWASGASAQEKEVPPRTEVAAMGGGLHRIRVEWVNVMALHGPEGTLLVDTGFPQVRDLLAAELEKIGARDVRYIVNTHWHFDHTGANELLGKRALIMAHRAVLPLVSGDQALLGETHKALPPEARPRLIFSHEVELSLNGERVRVIPLPGGHTGGDTVVLFKKANVLFVGDVVFQGQFPFVDVDHGGSALELPAVLQRVLDLSPPGVRIVPGHGRDLTADDVKAYRQMLLDTADVVRKEMTKEKSLAAIQEEDALKGWADWDGSFTRKDWIEMIYRSIPVSR